MPGFPAINLIRFTRFLFATPSGDDVVSAGVRLRDAVDAAANGESR